MLRSFFYLCSILFLQRLNCGNIWGFLRWEPSNVINLRINYVVILPRLKDADGRKAAGLALPPAQGRPGGGGVPLPPAQGRMGSGGGPGIRKRSYSFSEGRNNLQTNGLRRFYWVVDFL